MFESELKQVVHLHLKPSISGVTSSGIHCSAARYDGRDSAVGARSRRLPERVPSLHRTRVDHKFPSEKERKSPKKSTKAGFQHSLLPEGGPQPQLALAAAVSLAIN